MDNRLPKILVTMLDNLLEAGPISSWDIKGGPHFTQVTIRFPNEGMTDEGEVHYRRAPLSQIHRDRRRARNHYDQHYKSPELQSNNMASINDVGSPLFVQPFDNTTRDEICDPSVLPNTTADDALQQFTIADGIHDSIAAAGSTQVRDQGGNADDNGESEVVSMALTKETNKRGDIKDATASSDFDDKVSVADDVDDEMFSCDWCGTMMSGKPGSVWFRCTYCDKDMCDSCQQKELQCHVHHRKLISNFTCPEDMSMPWCDACGSNFDINNAETVVIQCERCEDFILCMRCFRKQYHSMDRQFCRRISIHQYMSEVY